jgi:hypothetical protein
MVEHAAAETAAAAYSQDSASSEEEPWDQRRAETSSLDSSTLAAVAAHDAVLEDGDLPALKFNNSNNSNKPTLTLLKEEEDESAPPSAAAIPMHRGSSRTPPRAGWLLRSGQTTRRPLQPPSMAGLVEEGKQVAAADATTESASTNKSETGRQQAFWSQLDGGSTLEDDDGPDDELAARRSADDRDVVRGRDDNSTGEESLEASQGETPANGDFCGETLNVISDMCGGLTQTHSTENAAVGSSSLRLPPVSDEQEEYTAIEVEFVEPNAGEPPKHTADVVAVPSKKSAFLSALARKAKADFDKGKADRGSMDEQHQGRGIDSNPSMESLDDDVYSRFSAQEKRKFLKLINTGHMPVEASHMVLEGRTNKEKLQKKVKQQKEKKEMASNRKNQRNKRLAFWKKNRPTSTSMPSPTEGDQEFLSEDESGHYEEDEFASEGESPARSTAPTPVDIPTPAVAAMVALDQKSPRPPSPPTSPPPLEELEENPARGEESEEERFARSGINYYDAVRRNASDISDEEAGHISTLAALAEKKKQRTFRPRGFAMLRDQRAKSAPRAARIPDSVSEDEPVDFSVQSRTVDSASVVSTKSSEPVLLTAPTNNTFGKRAQSRGLVYGGDTDAKKYMARKNVRESRERDESELPKKMNRELREDDSDSKPRSRVVADVAKAKIGKSDEAMLARIEQELLRTATPRQKGPKSTPKAAVLEEKQSEFQLDMDVDIEHYMQAADVYATANAVDHPNADNRSVYTTNTGNSAYTQSSRKRRPGAARGRLAKAKEVFQKQASKKKGWHDSIEAAAVSSNLRWLPGTGWVDYVDNSEQAADTPKSDERLKINLKKALGKNQTHTQVDGTGQAVPVPFPKDWEAEREEMIASKDPLGQGMPTEPHLDEPLPVHVAAEESPVLRRSEKVKRLKKHMSPSSTRMAQQPEKPTGWLASMKAATASLNQDGKSWDIANGWTIPGGDEQRASDVVDFNAPPPTVTNSEANQSRELFENYEADEQILGEDASEPLIVSEVNGQQVQRQTPVSRMRGGPPPPPPHVREPDGKLTQWVEKSEKGANPGSSAADGSDRAIASTMTEPLAANPTVVSVTTEPYVQLGDNGSVQQAIAGKHAASQPVIGKIPDKKSEYKARRSRDGLGAFPSIDDRPATAVVDIQKIDEADLNLFPEESREKRADRGYIASPPHSTARSIALPARGVVSPPPPPPASPPPDTLERSTLTPALPPSISAASSADSSRRGGGPIDMDEVDDTWESDDEQRFSVGFESRSGSGSATPPNSKSIPKLRGSAKDTSPLRGHRLLSRPGPEVDVLSDYSASKPDEAFQRELAAIAAPSSPGVQARLKALEHRRDGPPDWPGQGDESSQGQRSKPTAEWKSFIGKKVNAEAAAASQRRARGQHTAPAKTRSEDEDSLFQFDERKRSQANRSELEEANLSPISGKEENSTFDDDEATSDVYGSEGYGPSPDDKRSFLQRLTECAAPVVEKARNTVGDLPSAHLAFMKAGQFSPSKDSRFQPMNVCGKPDSIDEREEELALSEHDAPRRDRGNARAKSAPRPTKSSGGSSVVSEDFGAKTAYLEAIAMKAAVSKPRRSTGSRGRASSSVGSSTSSQHSEKWKSFLERKKVSGASPANARSSGVSDVSKAAERYAAAKVEEMMAEMNANSVSAPGSKKDLILRNEYSGEDDEDYKAMRSYKKRSGSRGEAQDLAAARVEAMMTQLSGSQIEEGEI